MRRIGPLAAFAVLLMPVPKGQAEEARVLPRVGEAYAITKSYEMSGQSSDGLSSSSARGRDTLVERVIGVRQDGLELEYDLPPDATAQERARSWQFPARVFRPSIGPMQLLNSSELEARVESWLKSAGQTRAVCGRWIFTWNAFRIECDPQSVIATIEEFDLRTDDLREGAPYRDIEASGAGTLVKAVSGPSGHTFKTVMQVDPDAVRRTRAEADVAAAEIMRKPVTLDAALRERAKEIVSGQIIVTFETDAAGSVQRRTRRTELETKLPDGRSERATTRETVERRLVSRPAPLR